MFEKFDDEMYQAGRTAFDRGDTLRQTIEATAEFAQHETKVASYFIGFIDGALALLCRSGQTTGL